ncbi:MAG: sulfotransferase [Planctomycetaceae bacterium]
MNIRLPHFLTAARFRVLLRAARFYGVMPPRFVRIIAAAGGLKPFRVWESLLYQRSVERFELHPQPVFIIGYWQSGHSVLHNLMACDPQFSTVRLRHTILPSAYRTLGPVIGRHLERNLPADREVDSLPGGLESLQGDDFLLAGLTELSAYYGYVFPDAAERILKQSLFFDGVSSSRIAAWRRTYETAIRAVSAEQGRSRFLSRNAANTCRIPQLLQMFPDAKFVHVHRHPDDAFGVQQRRWASLTENWSLQGVQPKKVRQHTLGTYEPMMRRYLQDRKLVRSTHVAEVAHADLVAAPVETLDRLYKKLALGAFDQIQAAVEQYAAADNGALIEARELSSADRREVRTRWQFAFDAFGYSGKAATDRAA